MSKKIKYFFWIVLILCSVYNIFLPLHPDEAYYWVWSKHLQLSYFDHPPMVAYLISIFTFFSNNEFFVRLGTVISMGVTGIIIFKLSKKIFSGKVAEKALIIFLLLPLTQAGFIVMTPDSPLILFWGVTLYSAYIYIFEEKSKYAYLTGLFGGLLLVSKYTGVLLLVSIFLFLIFSKYKKLFLKKEIYIAILIAILVFSGVIYWNYINDWVSFKFQFSHGVSEKKVLKLNSFFEFLGGQIGIFNPIFFIGLIYYLTKDYMKNIKDNKFKYLFITFVFTLLFFLYNSLFKKAEANWAAPAYIAGTILIAYFIEINNKRKLYISGIILSFIFIVILRFPEILPLPKRAVLKNKFYGYNKLFKPVKKYLNKDMLLFGDSYQNSSEAGYYLDKVDGLYSLPDSRYSMYNIWLKNDKKNGKLDNKKSIIIIENNDLKRLKKYFNNLKLLEEINYKDKYVNRRYYVYEGKYYSEKKETIK
ncbi:ArnT family glycosyltransferase [Haliovirga abyssi]|uniref:Glycosyltransferase RgtA/B/C/D-like domain-containing protein n=1 Tax=Haliovirga abyssi TaxID=2996794 RepID=A0AAU9DUF8_9FUSO|nr:glycosyltransferase family 39 protein [Haliovirga abyssi]BDU50919.1 hypothetical protein HLVA_14880 [Haliovirga abyssi]